MPRKYKTEHVFGYTILLVDDDAEYLEVTRSAAGARRASSAHGDAGPAALEMLRQSR